MLCWVIDLGRGLDVYENSSWSSPLRSAYYIATPVADEGDHDQREQGGPCERIGGCAPQSLSCSSGSRSLLVRALPVIGVARGAGGGARVAAGLG